MANPEELSQLQLAVRSRILESIEKTLGGAERVADTMYTKSDGTNYGMYQKSDDISALGDIWERVFKAGAVQGGVAGQVRGPEQG